MIAHTKKPVCDLTRNGLDTANQTTYAPNYTNNQSNSPHNDVSALSLLQYNYDILILFITEQIHISTGERRVELLGECSLNLPDKALHDIKTELLQMRAAEQTAGVPA